MASSSRYLVAIINIGSMLGVDSGGPVQFQPVAPVPVWLVLLLITTLNSTQPSCSRT